MRKLITLVSISMFIIEIFAQTQLVGVDQLLKNDLKIQPNTCYKHPIPEHVMLNAALGLTADQFVNANASVLCENPLSNLLKKEVQLSNGGTHHRYQQTWNGVPIEGQHLLLHEENGILNSINGTILTGLSTNTIPTLTKSSALAKVLDNNTKYAWQNAEMETDLQTSKNDPTSTYFPKGKLVLLPSNPISNADYKLAWRFNIYSIKPHNHIQVFVDAHTGALLKEVSLMKHTHVPGNGGTTYNGNQSFTCKHEGHHYELKSTDIETLEFTSGFPSTGRPFSSLTTTWNNHPAAINVHWGTEQVVKFLKDSLGRNGYDNSGTKIRALVGYPAQNAFWTGYSLVYGEGDNTTISSPTSLDIVAHEYTHAMLDKIVGFQYAGESGAIEEAYCDIFGELIEHFATGTADWLVGGQITLNQQGLRNLANPNSHGSPSVYKGSNWHNGPSDHWGVHTNSSVYSYWFHLLVHGNGTTVDGIGVPAATDLIYETLFYLQPYSDYIDLRNNSVAAANSLSQFTTTMVADVEAAWSEVGLGFAAQDPITGIIPVTGMTVYGGTPTSIQWDTSLSVTNVDILYSINGGVSWDTIDLNLPYKSGNYLWNIPQVYSTTALIQIAETGNPALRGFSSGYFMIQNSTNLPPIASDDEINTTQGFFEDISSWTNDLDDVELDTTSVDLISQPVSSEGTAFVYNNGTIRVNVNSSFVGSFSFQYSICDAGTPVLCDTATILVNAVKAPKQKWAMDDWGVLNINETLSGNLIRNDYLLDASWSFDGWEPVQLTHGSITIDNLNGDYTYTPNLPSVMGRDTIRYFVTNGVIMDTAYLHLFMIEDRPLAKDSMDLVILYEMTDGPNWDSTWNLNLPVLTWYGIDYNNLGITKIDLNRNQLTGTIPDFSNLNYLNYLHLNSNQISGSIPDFSNLVNLYNLYLGSNQISGSIPNLDSLSSLRYLSLGPNQLTGAIPEFPNLNILTNLNLNSNQISGSIPDFTNQNNLLQLNLSSNQISGSIPDFTNLNYLAVLNLSTNQLTGSIPDFSNLSNLLQLNLSSNQLKDSIPDFYNLNNLTRLDVESNLLTGSIPDFFNLNNIEFLYLGNNLLSDTIPDFSNLNNLRRIDLNNNRLTGAIPNFDVLNNLTDLFLNNNQLTGAIPDFTILNNLTSLRINYNNLTFDGINENLFINNFNYAPQGIIPIVKQPNRLNINPGGDSTLSTYYWHNTYDLNIDTIIGSNYYQPQKKGYYYCSVENAIITNPNNTWQFLVLKSDTVYFIPKCNIISDLTENTTVCIADSIDSGFPYMKEYFWMLNGDTLGTTQKIAVYQAGTYILHMQDSCMNPLVSDTILITIDTTCVWPGDTNFDGIVNHYDLQNIGLHYGATGPARTDDPMIFSPSQGGGWNQQTNAGLDLKYVDANGDGLINASDTTVILQHYGKVWGNYIPPVDSTISPIRILPKIVGVPQGVNGSFSISFSIENSLDSSSLLYGLAFETVIQAPVDVSEQLQIDSSQFQGANQFLAISESADTNLVQTALTKTDLTDVIIQDASSLFFFGTIGTEKNLPTGDTVSIIQVKVENARLTTVNSNLGTGQFNTAVQGGTTSIYFTEHLAFSLLPKPAFCAPNGQIALDILKGTAPYTFQWSNGPTSASNTGLTVGTYQVTVTDALGKMITAEASVEGIDPITAQPVLSEPTLGQSDGSVTLNLLGGSGTYDVQWNTGHSGSTINNLPAGNYIALVNDVTCVESFQIDLKSRGTQLDLKVFLEGAFNSSTGRMTDWLRSKALIPATDPYDSLLTVSPIIFSVVGQDAIVDWIYIEVVDPNLQPISSTPAFVQRDGTVVGIDGVSLPQINELLPGPYDIVLKHRNHLPITSPIPILIQNGVLSHDFTISNSYTNGTSFGQKEIVPGVWAMFAGNAEQTNLEVKQINGADFIIWNTSNGFFLKYNNADFNLDSDVNGLDKILHNKNNGIFTAN